MKVIHKPELTESSLFVNTSESSDSWDKSRIVDSILKETSLSEKTAEDIATAVEEELLNSRINEVTTAQIRELVNSELIKHGYSRAVEEYRNLSIPVDAVKSLLFNPYTENSNQTHNPESINLTIAETIFQQYALSEIFDKDIAEMHRNGVIHVHDLGFSASRLYCGGHSLEYVKKYGLNLPNITSVSSPAKHPEALLGHMVKMSAVLQGNYAGAVGWEAVNMFFAPFLRGLEYNRIKQLAQMLIFEFNQLAGARGGQVVFTDFNLYYGIPAHFKDTPAVGPGGQYMTDEEGNKLTYKDFEYESNLFLKALFEVYLEGDSQGKVFFFPKPLLHINEDAINSPGWDEFFTLACKVAIEKGITYFVFDRGDTKTVSACCRLKLAIGEEDLKNTKTPEKMRFSALQNVTINLPRIAMEVIDEFGKWNLGEFFKKLSQRVELVARAHLNKKTHMKKVLKSNSGLLSFYKLDLDGQPYVNMNKLTMLCGIMGLNECVELATGKQLHEDKQAFGLGLQIIGWMNLQCQRYSNEYNMNLVLEESPAESAAYRLAEKDLQLYPELAKKILNGNVKTGDYYYTNSVHLAYDADVDYVTRIIKQAKFSPMIQAGAISHCFLGESKPPVESIKSLVMNTFKHTEAPQICFSPDFTVCDSCNITTRGIHKKCPKCKSENVYGVTRIVGYFSNIKNWNKGKLAELKDRRRGLAGGTEKSVEEAITEFKKEQQTGNSTRGTDGRTNTKCA